jgi:hypothetical protein
MDKSTNDLVIEMNNKLDELQEMIVDIHNTICKKINVPLTDAEIEQINRANRGAIIEQILDILHEFNSEFGYVLHSNLLRRVYKKLRGRAPEFLMIINTMKLNGQIEESMIGESVAYRLTPEERAKRPKKSMPSPVTFSTPRSQSAAAEPSIWDRVVGPKTPDPIDYRKLRDDPNIIKSATGDDVNLNEPIDLTK